MSRAILEGLWIQYCKIWETDDEREREMVRYTFRAKCRVYCNDGSQWTVSALEKRMHEKYLSMQRYEDKRQGCNLR